MLSLATLIKTTFLDLAHYIEKRRRPIFVKMVFAYVLYINMIANNLINHMDGIWHGSYSNDSGWCISIGRWARTFVYRLHFNDHSIPLNAFLTFLFLVAGMEIITYLFCLQEKKLADYIVSFLFISNTVVSVWMSHAYMSIDFSACFFLSVLCAYFIIRSLEINTIEFILAGALCLGVYMGIYQAYVGCTLLVLLVYLQYMLIKNDNVKKIVIYIRNSAITGGLGFFLYEIMLKLMARRYNVSFSNYKNFDQISLKGIVSNFIPDVINAYKYFCKYFLGMLYHSNKFEGLVFLVCIALIFVCFIKYSVIPLSRTNRVRALLCFALLGGVPAACNISCVLAPLTTIAIQQTPPLALFIPIIFAITAANISNNNKKRHVAEIVAVAAAIIIIWGNAYVTQADEEAMREGTNATASIAENIVETLIDKELYPSDEYTYLFYGSPEKNIMFYEDELYRNANMHAKFGNFVWSDIANQRSWIGVFRHLLGVNMPGCKEDLIASIIKSDEFTNMPVYPKKGSIEIIDGVVVVKVSE